MKLFSHNPYIIIPATSVLGTFLLFSSVGAVTVSTSYSSIQGWIVTFVGGILGGWVMVWFTKKFTHFWSRDNDYRRRLIWFLSTGILGLCVSSVIRMVLLVLLSEGVIDINNADIIVLLILGSFVVPIVLLLPTVTIGCLVGFANYILTKTD